MEQILEIKNLSISFDTDLGEVRAVKKVDFAIEKGEIFGIVGESGSGKSVATKSILRLGPPNIRIKSGEIIFQGRDIIKISGKELQTLRGGQISMVFQDSMSALNPVYTVGKKMVELLRRHEKLTKKEAEVKILELFNDVGIVNPERCFASYPHELSGGMRQRVMIAMAVCCNPELLIADEPTTALDVTIQAQILHLLRDIQKQKGMSVILITHDLGVVAQMCSRIAVMCGGYVVEIGSSRDIFHNPKHPYTQALIRSMPSAGTEKFEQFLERNNSDDNRNDNLCPFFGRCRHVQGICGERLPVMQEIGDGQRTFCHLGGEIQYE